MSRPIFLDHHSTTPVNPNVLEAMIPFFSAVYGNPHSADHGFGWDAEAAVEAARRDVAALIGARSGEIVFTSGATESNNLALRGVATHLPSDRRHIVTSTFEHPCVAAVADLLESSGFSVSRVPPDRNGIVSSQAVAAAIRPETGLVSIMTANHEIGAIQPIGEIGTLTHQSGIAFHTDAAQAAGKIPLDVDALGVDLMSLSAHKIYGPKGIGALFVRRRPGLRLAPLIVGGGQERGLRSGTVPVPLAVGFGVAARFAGLTLADEAIRIGALRDKLKDELQAKIPELEINGGFDHRLPHNLNVKLPAIAAVDLLYLMKDRIAVSTGAACASAKLEPSRTLLAIGLSETEALASIRIGLGQETAETDIDVAVEVICEAWSRLSGSACQTAGIGN